MEAGGLLRIDGKHKLNYTMDVRISLGLLVIVCGEPTYDNEVAIERQKWMPP